MTAKKSKKSKEKKSSIGRPTKYSEELTYIYALCCPDTSKIRYIGKSNDPEKRLKQHLRENRRNYPVYNWINKLRMENKIPLLKILSETRDWKSKEKELIAKNVSEGGDQP